MDELRTEEFSCNSLQGSSPGRIHRDPPVLVDAGETLPLRRELLVDVFRVEDGLQIQPVALDGEPLVDNLAHHLQRNAERFGKILEIGMGSYCRPYKLVIVCGQ